MIGKFFWSRFEKLVADRTDEALASWLDTLGQQYQVSDWQSLLSNNREILKASWTEYTKAKRDGAFEGLKMALSEADDAWFSTEDIWFLVVPDTAVMSRAQFHTKNYFEKSFDLFRTLPEETGEREAIAGTAAHDAIRTQFNWAVKKAVTQNIEGMIEYRKNDLYHFDSNVMTRTNSLILTSHSNGLSKWNEGLEKRDIERNFSQESYNYWKSDIEFDGGYLGLQGRSHC